MYFIQIIFQVFLCFLGYLTTVHQQVNFRSPE